MRLAKLLGALLVIAALLAACTPNASAAASKPSPAAGGLNSKSMLANIRAADLATEDVSQVQLDRRFSTNLQRLGQKSIQFFDFCVGWRHNESLREPEAYNLGQLQRWSADALFAVDSINPNQKFVEISDPLHRKIGLPADKKREITIEQAALYAYEQRLLALSTATQQGFISISLLHTREDAAFVALISTGYSGADHDLWQYYYVHCGVGG